MPLHRLILGTWLSTVLATTTASADAPSFTRHVSPMLFKLGCSAGSCHGSFSGKGGMQLSLFASVPELDYENIRYGGYGRRLDLQSPEASLLLQKPTTAVAHGGGRKLPRDSEEYRLLHDWISAGAPNDADAVRIVEVRVEPKTFTVERGAAPQALKVTAVLADGEQEDVTRFAAFESRDPSVAVVDASGCVTATQAGDVPLLIHYAGHVSFAIAEVPGTPMPELQPLVEKPRDAIDRMIGAKLARLNITPSVVCDDVEFLRRVYLDTTSVLPNADEIETFLADKSPDKRSKLIDRLLEHPLHAAQWATKMSDLLGADNRFLNATTFHDWFRNKFEQNLGWDQIAYGILCATAADERDPEEIRSELDRVRNERRVQQQIDKLKKENKEIPAELTAELDSLKPPIADASKKPWQTGDGARKTLAALYSSIKYLQIIRNPESDKQIRMIDSKAIALQTANALLGVQLTCAQCHKHPSDKWTQRDFYGFAAVFSHVQYSGVDPKLAAMKISLIGPHVVEKPCETFDDPLTHEPVTAKALDGPAIEVTSGVDPRRKVWEWMTAKDNPYFARGMVNRVWAHYLGRGFFEPVDAQAAANPPSHPELLDELARDFATHGFDIRRLERRILNSLAYQRSWRTNPSNAADRRNFSHRYVRRLTAEQLLDAVLTATGTSHKLTQVYNGSLREGERIIEMSLSRFRGDDAYVLLAFGKPLRVQSCDCERSPAPSLSQSLYLYNDEALIAKIADPAGRVQKLVDAETDDAQVLNELYLATLSRGPTKTEAAASIEYVKASPSRAEGFQDVLWSLLNRQEFIINR